ncbi:hypothetical protein BGW39_008108 [Mortierella sp. 14UC]|nr:hypothetical protein BGW39_008108 [Mortierella sp. 14UC]
MLHRCSNSIKLLYPSPCLLSCSCSDGHQAIYRGRCGASGSNFDTISQFISLDLSIAWNTTSPAWTNLADGPRQSLFPAAFSSDEQVMYAFHIWGTASPWKYDVQKDTWQEMTTPQFENIATVGVKAVTDPRTGLIYLAAGSDNVNNHASPLKQLDIFDPVSQTIHSIDLQDPAKPFPVRLKYGPVWSNFRNSILYWGGRYNISDPRTDIAENVITELSADSWTWSVMPTKGAAPEVRSFHCMAGNEDGTKVVMYGGQLRNDTLLGEIWILDVPTATWSQGPSGPIRASAACTIAGDQFIIWAGRRGAIVNALPEMMIYNITSAIYVTEYTPPAFYKDLKPPPPLTRTTAPWPTDLTTDSTMARRLVAGCVVGGLVLTIEDLKLQQTLRDLEAEEKELEEQQREIDQRRQLLVLQRKESASSSSSGLRRGPTAFVADEVEIISSPTTLLQISPVTLFSTAFSPEILNDRRTVQAGPVDMYQGDSYADIGPRRESELAQDVIEPMHEPSSRVNNAVPDLVYEPPPNVGMDWTKRQQDNHPHTIVDLGQANNEAAE